MTAITETAVSAATLEHVLATGDLAKLTTPQRVAYYGRTCETLGLNPLTRPFRYLSFQGQIQLYATRDACDQLRKLHKISIVITGQSLESNLYVVTVKATTPDGRTDEDVGVVTLGNHQAESRANQLMKAVTKAKRRVTLSICGLGFVSEDELDTMPGAQTFDAEAAPPPKLEAAAPSTTMREHAAKVQAASNGNGGKRTVRDWLDEFQAACANATTQDEAEAILKRPQVADAATHWARYPEVIKTVEATRQALIDRLWGEVDVG